MPRVQGRTGAACGRKHRGFPRTCTCLSGFAQGTSLCLGRTSGSLPDPFGPVLRLRWILGLTKGAKKQNNFTY
jgi:hypothetical protein